MTPLIPFGPNAPDEIQAALGALYAAVQELQNPGGPSNLAHVALKADLSNYLPADYPGGVLICDEINAIIHSTQVAGVYTWLRADGGAI